jgi:membrane-bound metal-dependent hydrolase YbcI (DUF457 family)
MLGRSHLVSGTAAFTGSTLVLHYSPSQVITGLIVVTCAALLPDIDHQKAYISNVYGPVTVGFSHLVATLAGGHRKGTHSLLGIFLLGALAQICVTHRHAWWADTLLSALLIVTVAAGLKILTRPAQKKAARDRAKRRRMAKTLAGTHGPAPRIPLHPLSWIDELLPIPVVIALVFLTNVNMDAVPPALMMGCLVHVLGDCLTNSGCPIFWPVSRWRLKFGLFSTGKKVERWVVFPVMILGTFVMACVRVFHGMV